MELTPLIAGLVLGVSLSDPPRVKFVDINTATAAHLNALPGVGKGYSIIKGQIAAKQK